MTTRPLLDGIATVDAPALDRLGPSNGGSLVVVREARRASKRGERERARDLAKRVVAAWGAANIDTPAVEEMRALLAGHP